VSDSNVSQESIAEAGSLAVTIVTPTGTRVEYRARQVRAPGADGDFGVLPGHVPFMTALRVGAIVLDGETGRQVWATSGGFVEVLAHKVTILAESAERSDEIDLVRAEASRKRALERLGAQSQETLDITRTRASLARAINRLHIAAQSNS